VLNAREGWWQDRKRRWIDQGIKSELGRGENGFHAAPGGSPMVSGYDKEGKRLTGLKNINGKNESVPAGLAFGEMPNYDGGDRSISGTSIFDPVLCEFAYRWFSPSGGTIIDPFAGGSVRGIVASKLGRRYVGHELRAEQVAANREQATQLCGMDPLPPVWVEGDSRGMDKTCADVEADMLLTCPPYADLEVYSDDPADLSTLDYPEFRSAYFEIIAKACRLLKQDSYAVCVVGEVRDKKGNYYDFVGDTVQAFRDAGLHFYNEAILVTCVGSLPIRAGKQFSTSRKLGKTHQNILVFVKGDGKKAAQRCGEVEVDVPDDENADLGEQL
jgi:DNA modification methylase